MSIDLHMTSFILTNSYLVRERERERAKEGGGDKNTLKKNPLPHDDMSLCAYDSS